MAMKTIAYTIAILYLSLLLFSCEKDPAVSTENPITIINCHSEEENNNLDHWVKITSYPQTARRNIETFTIDSITYFIGGVEFPFMGHTCVLKYNNISNKWSETTPIPKLKGTSSNFSYGQTGYMVGGRSDFQSTNEILTYNSEDKSWTTKANAPMAPFQLASHFIIGKHVYIVGGIHRVNGQSSVSNETWRYDIDEDNWQRMSDFPGGGRFSGTAFSSDNFGYFGLGNSVNTSDRVLNSDFWRYDPTKNIWTQIDDFPGGRRFVAVNFEINNGVYVGMGISQENEYQTDLYKLDFESEQWICKTEFPGAYRVNAIAYSFNNQGYVGLGFQYSNDDYFTDIWKYIE